MTEQTKRILIIDDHQLFAEGLGLILGGLEQITEVAICRNGLEALADRKELSRFDLVLADLDMPQLSGFGFLKAVAAQKLDIDVAIVSGNEQKSQIEKALQLGAKGFIPKDSTTAEMLQAVQQLLQGQRYLPSLWEGVVDWRPSGESGPAVRNDLTSRQQDVLVLMSEGMQNKQIATALGISVSSVKGHIELLFENLGVNNRAACIQVANQRSLI